MRAIDVIVTIVLLVGPFGLANDTFGEASNGDRPVSGSNNIWHAHHDEADTVVVFVHGFTSDSRDAWFHAGDESEQGVYWLELIRRDPAFA